jgi:hypothetical protein
MQFAVPGFEVESRKLAVTLSRYLLPVAVLQVAAVRLRGLMNADRMFGFPEVVGPQNPRGEANREPSVTAFRVPHSASGGISSNRGSPHGARFLPADVIVYIEALFWVLLCVPPVSMTPD